MSRTIDEYVASMQFDNKNFERNVNTSLGTLEKLKQKLNLTGAAKGLENVDAAAKKMNFSGLSNGVESVRMKFSALEVMAVTALSNITNQAVNAGKRLAAAFTIEPIKTGFQEYETQIGAVQTILANTSHAGTDLDDVNRALDELNTYADKTIYNFTEMTRNIGTFTAAGVDLNTSVQSIKGIANLAAVSGSTSQQASTAMYQLSQALAAGKVSLMDWNSVVNAGMGGKLFQDALVRTSELLKTGAKDAIESYGSFRESLTKGEWLTTEVLTETLKQLSGAYSEADLIAQGFTESQAKEIASLADTAVQAATKVKTFTQLMDTLKEAAQSGWTQTWELLIGDFEQSKELWTGVSDAVGGFIGKSAESRNTMLAEALQSNWDKLKTKIKEAGVETTDFEKQVRAVAESHGMDVDKLVEEYGTLEKAIRKGKFSSDILNEALDKVGMSAADLAKINRTLKFDSVGEDVKELQTALKDLGYDLGKKGVDGIIGQYTEGAIKAFQGDHGLEVTGIVDEKTLAALKEVTDGVEGLRESCSGLIDEIDKLGGREKLIKSFKNIFKGMSRLVSPITTAFRNIFPPTTAEQVSNLIDGFHQLSKKFKQFFSLPQGKELRKNLYSTFKGVFSIVDIGIEALKTLGKGALKLFGSFGKLGGGVLSVTGSLGEWIFKIRNSIKESDIFGKSLDAVVGFIGKAIDVVRESGIISKTISGVINAVGSGIVKIKEFVGAFLELPSVQFAIESLKNTFTGIGETLKGRFSGGVEIFKNFVAQLKSMDSISLSNIGTIVKDFFKNIFKHFTDMGDGVTIFDYFFEAVQSFGEKIVSALESAGIKIGEIVEKIKGFISIIASNVKNNLGGILAIGVLVLLFAMIKKIKDAIEAIAHPLEFLDDLGEGLKSIGNAIKTSIKAQAVKSLAISIGIIAGSLFLLSMINWKQLLPAVGALVVVMGLLMGALALIGSKKMGISDNLGDIGKLAGLILSLGGSLLLIAYAAKIVSGISWDGLTKGAYVLAGFTLALVIMCNSVKNLNAVDFAGFGSMMFSLAGALILFSVAIGILGNMDPGVLIQGGLAIVAFLGMMVGMMAATNLLTKQMSITAKNFKSKSFNFTGMIFGLAVALIAFTAAVAILGNMDRETLIQGGLAIVAFLGMMVGMMAATKLLGKNVAGFGAAMVGLGIGLVAMAAAVGILGNMDKNTLGQGIGVMAAFMGLMVVMMAATRLLGKNSKSMSKFGVMMIGFGAAMLLLTASIAVLGLLDPADIDKGVETITKMGVMMGALMIVTRFAKDIKMGTLIGISVAIGVLAISVAALSFIEPDKLKSATTALSILMGAFAIVVAATGLAKSCTLTLIIMTAVVAALAFILYKLSELPINNTLLTAASLSMLLLSLSGAMLICSFVRGGAEAALNGVAALAVFIGGIGLIMAAIAGLAELFPGMEDFLNNAIPILDTIGYALGSFVGNIVGGFLGGATSGFGEIGTNLSEFMINLQPFIDGIKSIDATAAEGAKSLAAMILAVTGARILDAIGGWLTGGSSMADFADQLVSFGDAIVKFSTTVSGKINEDAVTAAANAGKIMAEMAATLPNSGGLLGKIMGENDMADFANQLVPFGEDIVKFSTTVSGKIDEGAVEAAANAGKMMATMANSIPNSWGLVDILTGSNNMVTFGFQLKSFGTAIKDFAAEVDGLNTESIDTAVSAGMSLTALANALPESGGLWSVFSADNNMSTFAKEIKKFGEGIYDFSDEVTGIDTNAVDTAATAGSKLAKMAKTLPEGSVLDRMGTFGKKIKSLGEKLSDFADEVSDVTAAKFTDIADGIKKLAGIKVDNADNINSFVESLSKISSESIDKFVASFKDSAPKVIASVTAMITLTEQAVRNKGPFLKTAFKDIVSAAGDAAKSQEAYTKFGSAGGYLVEGFANGISANTYKATAKAIAMANAAVTAAKAALKINSPSKVFIPIGKSVPEGFAMGIEMMGGTIKSSVNVMSNQAVKATSSVIGRIADVLDSDMDVNPVITPVMDLSEIYSGISKLNSMMSSLRTSQSVLNTVGSINTSMNNSTSSSDKVVSAINNLKKGLNVRSGDTYNVNGITYDDGSNVSSAVKELVRATRMESRV